jgi:hypothetical protein
METMNSWKVMVTIISRIANIRDRIAPYCMKSSCGSGLLTAMGRPINRAEGRRSYRL